MIPNLLLYEVHHYSDPLGFSEQTDAVANNGWQSSSKSKGSNLLQDSSNNCQRSDKATRERSVAVDIFEGTQAESKLQLIPRRSSILRRLSPCASTGTRGFSFEM
jgi:hypothetical protein